MFVTQGEVDSISLKFDAQLSFDDRQEREFGEILSDPSPLVKLDILGSGNTSEAAFENQHQLGLKGMPAIDREEVPVDKLFRPNESALELNAVVGPERMISLRKRMSAFPQMESEVLEPLKVSLPIPSPQNEPPNSFVRSTFPLIINCCRGFSSALSSA